METVFIMDDEVCSIFLETLLDHFIITVDIILSKKSPTGTTEQTPKPEYLIALSRNLLGPGSVGIRSHLIVDGHLQKPWLVRLYRGWKTTQL